MALVLNNFFRLAMIAALLMGLAFCATHVSELQGISMEVSNPAVIPLDSHSTAHLEANDVVKCDNILSIFMDNKCEKHNIIKQMEDGQIGCEVVQMSKRGVLLKTAYIMVGVDEQELNRIMSAKGCSKIWP